MPVYLFTYHGYATWMPDREQGYVHHTRGLQPHDPYMAEVYRRQQREDMAIFDERAQGIIIETAINTQQHLNIVIHAVSTDPTHVHVLLSWSHERDWLSLRNSIKTAISRAMNATVAQRTWLSKKASRKHIRDHAHFDHHMLEYLPKHSGAKWFRQRDLEAARRGAALPPHQPDLSRDDTRRR